MSQHAASCERGARACHTRLNRGRDLGRQGIHKCRHYGVPSLSAQTSRRFCTCDSVQDFYPNTLVRYIMPHGRTGRLAPKKHLVAIECIQVARLRLEDQPRAPPVMHTYEPPPARAQVLRPRRWMQTRDFLASHPEKRIGKMRVSTTDSQRGPARSTQAMRFASLPS